MEFKQGKTVRNGSLLKPLIEKRGHKCECCKLEFWLNKPINLQVHHINGDRSNNSLENLQLLCLNCHSYTDSFSKPKEKPIVTDEEFVEALKNNETIHQALLELNLSTAGTQYTRARKLIKKHNLFLHYEKKINYCIDCGAPIEDSSLRCSKCHNRLKRVSDRPNREELKNLIRTKPFTTIGKQFQVSDNAIRKWCKAESLPSSKKEINKYSDEEWILI